MDGTNPQGDTWYFIKELPLDNLTVTNRNLEDSTLYMRTALQKDSRFTGTVRAYQYIVISDKEYSTLRTSLPAIIELTIDFNYEDDYYAASVTFASYRILAVDKFGTLVEDGAAGADAATETALTVKDASSPLPTGNTALSSDVKLGGIITLKSGKVWKTDESGTFVQTNNSGDVATIDLSGYTGDVVVQIVARAPGNNTSNAGRYYTLTGGGETYNSTGYGETSADADSNGWYGIPYANTTDTYHLKGGELYTLNLISALCP